MYSISASSTSEEIFAVTYFEGERTIEYVKMIAVLV